MIANSNELKMAVRSLRIMQQSLDALRAQLEVENPDLLAVTAPSYERRIQTLQKQIAHFLCDHPDALSLILGPTNSSDAQLAAA